MADYALRLAREMTLRGVSDADTVEALREVRDVLHRGGDLEAEFGTPADYAATFTIQRPTSRWGTAGGIVAVLWMASMFVAYGFFDVSIPGRPGMVILLPALGFMLLGMGLIYAASLVRAKRLANQ